MKNKFKLQDSQYSFPYHYIVSVEKNKINLTKNLSWGLEYLRNIDFLIENINGTGLKSVLEVGCGDGYVIGQIKKKFNNCSCTGVDLSDKSIKLAKVLNTNDINFFNSDVSEIDGVFDIVFMNQVMEHVPNEQVNNVLLNTWDKVGPGGKLIITVPGKGKKLIKKHYRHYDTKMLEEIGVILKTDKYNVRSIFKPSILYKLIIKLFFNRLWQINIPVINKLLFKSMKSGSIEKSYDVAIIINK
jgi:2-polyprenyl-3-methyl-5-hydroxy-6-metoxy-1,4-benzoquinol methylase